VVDGVSCAAEPEFSITLLSGQSIMITCWNLNVDNENFEEAVVEYIDKELRSTQNTQGLARVQFKETTTTNCFG
jgi:hypothetical protein